MENTGYLFAAFGIIWLMVFGYLFILMRRQEQIKRDMEILEDLCSDKDIDS